MQWRRSVLKSGGSGRVSQVKPSNCFTLHPMSTTSKHSAIPFPNTCRRLEKLVLPSIFDTSLSSLMMWNLQLYNNSFEWKNVTFYGGQNILWPLLHIFRGSGPPQHPRSTPLAPWVSIPEDRGEDTVIFGVEGKQSPKCRLVNALVTQWLHQK